MLSLPLSQPASSGHGAQLCRGRCFGSASRDCRHDTGSGDYTAGGKGLASQQTSVATLTAIVDFADLSFTGVTLTARGALIYNTSSTVTNAAIAVLDFGGDKTATAGTFTIQFPAFTTSAAILRIA